MSYFFFFFFNDTATTDIYTLSLHDALPIYLLAGDSRPRRRGHVRVPCRVQRSEEHTSELQSPYDLVCRLLLEKKNNQNTHLRAPRTSVTTRTQPHHHPRNHFSFIYL